MSLPQWTVRLEPPPILVEIARTAQIGPPAAYQAARRTPEGAIHAVQPESEKTACGFAFATRNSGSFLVTDPGRRCLSCDYSVRRRVAMDDEVIELKTLGWPRGIVDFSGIDYDDQCGCWISAMDQVDRWRPFYRLSPVRYWSSYPKSAETIGASTTAGATTTAQKQATP